MESPGTAPGLPACEKDFSLYHKGYTIQIPVRAKGLGPAAQRHDHPAHREVKDVGVGSPDGGTQEIPNLATDAGIGIAALTNGIVHLSRFVAVHVLVHGNYLFSGLLALFCGERPIF